MTDPEVSSFTPPEKTEEELQQIADFYQIIFGEEVSVETVRKALEEGSI